ncbi:DUF3047 domain-containing protein [Octadecabacter sp. 1_MG-2023]|uniref:DUF3047 domain-containing protein n=1 Tax=unclassified Octadecabacter TaxID=196158 RepID=UPI001C089949|nr:MULTISPECIES: DUF3047 domain-containing protein [unclassified Octadecabacter]MBU2993891.1 DUF3047 domain-containing protein [Octadecabacter sp. B2R22]MDO6735263.1 DUF3047 domain-containing protein [Octadecabacter sp. 1_MG-2023]
MRILSLALPVVLAASAAAAGPISFGGNWNEQRLQLFNSNDYSFNGGSMSIASDGGVSLAWARTGRGDWGSTSASWNWSVDQSVPATDLRRKGGDDRNISVYFVFLPEADAASMEGANIRQLNSNPNVRILQYVWGGNHSRGAIQQSPYAPGQGANVILRSAGTGSNSESVNLASDYAAAFGGSIGALVGVAVSADSDDTDSTIRASVSNLAVR